MPIKASKMIVDKIEVALAPLSDTPIQATFLRKAAVVQTGDRWRRLDALN